jgi:hypothetical protein
MSAEIELHPEAVAEVRAARLWYAERNETAATALMAEVDHALEVIAESPTRWPEFDYGTRRYLLRRFRYSMILRINSDSVTIVAFAHFRRRPGDDTAFPEFVRSRSGWLEPRVLTAAATAPLDT